MEMLVVVAIIVALAGIGGYFLMGQLNVSQKDVAKTQVKGPLTQAVQTYFLRHQQYPGSLAQLRQADDRGPAILDSDDALIDPWGRQYQYDPAGPMNQGMKPDIWTIAPDNQKLGNWASNVPQ
jgi:type II secretory pathway pseudopilin PulG